MPDPRAVVENIYDTETGALLGSRVKPRAVCAVSDDRQWLVMLGRPAAGYFGVFRRLEDEPSFFSYQWEAASTGAIVKDTGQSAEQVLADFERGRTS